MEVMQLNLSEEEVGGEGECESKLKADITTEGSHTRMQSNRADKPLLRHSTDHTSNTEAESGDRSDPWWQAAGIIVDFGVISAHALLEEEVIAEGNAFINGKPISNKILRPCVSSCNG
jgi:hypothetical protein